MKVNTDRDRVMIVGLDSSLAGFGHAAIELRLSTDRAQLVEAGSWETKRNPDAVRKGDDLQERIDFLAESLLDFLSQHSPDLVFIEAAQIIQLGGPMTTARLWRVRGMVDGVCRSLCLPLYEFSPIKIKNDVTGFKRPKGQKRVKGDGPTKADVAKALLKFYPLTEEQLGNDNLTDAIAVAHLGRFSEPCRWLVDQRRGENSTEPGGRGEMGR